MRPYVFGLRAGSPNGFSFALDALEEDVDLVVMLTKVSRERAIGALRSNDGDIVKAFVALLS